MNFKQVIAQKRFFLTFLSIQYHFEQVSLKLLLLKLSGNVKRHIERSWKALCEGEDLPDVPPEEEKMNIRIGFFEATTESICQFTLSSVILRIYGVGVTLGAKFSQYFSLTTSLLSLTLAFVTVSNLTLILSNITYFYLSSNKFF